jgi:hypothetical protein
MYLLLEIPRSPRLPRHSFVFLPVPLFPSAILHETTPICPICISSSLSFDVTEQL